MNLGDGIWDDGEWISWSYINRQIDDASKRKTSSHPRPGINPDAGWRDSNELIVTAESTTPAQSASCAPDCDKSDKLLECMIVAAKQYLAACDRHLPIYGELGELYAERRYRIIRHKPNTQGSDGRIGDEFVEIKTVTPMKGNDLVTVKRAGNFGKLIVVKISTDFQFESKIISRSRLPKGPSKFIRISWGSISDESTV